MRTLVGKNYSVNFKIEKRADGTYEVLRTSPVHLTIHVLGRFVCLSEARTKLLDCLRGSTK